MVIVVLTVLLTTGFSCWAAPAVVLAGRGNGRYEALGKGFENVRSLELILTYDPAALTEPRVKQNGLIFGAMMTPDFSTPGLIRVSITSNNPKGITGNGSIAMFSFNMYRRGPGLVTSFAATLTSTEGNDIPLPAPQVLADDKGRFLGNPFPDKPDQTGEPSGSITGTPDSSGTVSPAKSNGLKSPGGADVPVERDAPGSLPEPSRDAVIPSLPQRGATEAASGEQGAEGATPQALSAPGGTSILERFKGYAGPLTSQALSALFVRPPSAGIRQVPPVAVSDGVTRVTVYLTLQPFSGQSPNFAVSRAKQVSLKRVGAEYALELIPDAGVFEASVMVRHQSGVAEYPLVVTPPLKPVRMPGGKVDDAAYTSFLKGYAEGKGDLNGDGRTDYLDLYISTANYLSGTKKY